jgi:hypothetical protein
MEELDKLGLWLQCKSSLMVTSRATFDAASVECVGFKITGKNNNAQEKAILASYVAADPEIDTVQLHLKVQIQCLHCCQHVAGQGHFSQYWAVLCYQGLCTLSL